MSAGVLGIAIVGHTNTGKTSLVRTLTHNRDFGEVRDESGTTRRITQGELVAESGARIQLNDSPGLENAPALLDWLDGAPGERHDGPARIRRFLDDSDAVRRFDHEARVLELLLEVNVALYVIDAREPVLEKYQDELAVLGLCARPIVAVLNFTASSDSREAQWRDALARVRLHTVLAFDVAVRDPATELALFEKLKSQLDDHADVLSAWLEHRRAEERQRRQAALEAIASLLLDVAACVREIEAGNETERQRVWRELSATIHRREQACVDALLELYRFGREDYDDAELPVSDGRWQADPFDPETLRHYGLKASSHAAAGASGGAVVDVATGGLSLGGGMLVGAALGAGTGLVRSAGSRLIDRLRSRERIQVGDGVAGLLVARSVELLAALMHRGHGNPARIQAQVVASLDRRRLPRAVRRARHHPDWSALNDGGGVSGSRLAAQAELAAELGDSLSTADGPESGA